MSKRIRIILLFAVLALVFSRTFLNSGEHVESRWYTDGLVLKVFRPVGETLSGVSDAMTNTFNKYYFLLAAGEQNKKLASELETLRTQNMFLKQELQSTQEQAHLSSTYSSDPDAFLSARILSYDLFDTAKTIIIDKGKDQGMQVNNIVVVGDGLVGRVLQTFARSSKILLLIDQGFSVDAVNERSSIRILVSGMNDETLATIRQPFLTQVEYLENAAEMREHDVLVTSGLGGIFPPGIPIGTVDHVSYSDKNLFDKAWVLPAVDFTKLTHVYVLLAGHTVKVEKVTSPTLPPETQLVQPPVLPQTPVPTPTHISPRSAPSWTDMSWVKPITTTIKRHPLRKPLKPTDTTSSGSVPVESTSTNALHHWRH